MLAAHFRFISLGVLKFRCRLTPPAAESPMYLEFATIPEHGRIDPASIMMKLLRSFPELLRTKGMKESAVMFLDGEGCLMQFKYPGRTLPHVSQFLRDRPVDLWPEVTLCLQPTNELRRRAQDILAFLRDSDTIDGIVN